MFTYFQIVINLLTVYFLEVYMIKSMGCIEVEHDFNTYEIEYTIFLDNTLSINKITPYPPKSMDAEKLLIEKLTPNTPSVNHVNYKR